MATKTYRYPKAGDYVASLRHKAGLSQYDLSKKLGLKYYTFISQVETGFASIPSRTMRDWARALGVDPTVFAKTLLREYDPHLFDLLYGEKRRGQ